MIRSTGFRRLLRRGHEHHSEHSWARLLAGLDAGDTADEQLAHTWIAAQELRLLYRCPDRARAEQHLYRWLTHCADTDIPELHRLARPFFDPRIGRPSTPMEARLGALTPLAV